MINDEIKAQDTTISASDTTLNFDLGKTTNAELRATIPVELNSKAVKVKLIDAAGNETTSSVSVSIKVDYTCPTGSISYLPSNTVYPGSPLTILANFSEDLADTPVMQIAINGSNSLSASNMSKITAAQYSYAYTVGNGNGEANITFASGTDKAGNPIVAAPTAGGSFTVNNTVLPAGVYKKTAVLDSINDVALAGNTLTVKTAGASVEYNVTNNTTVKNIMGGENNIKFTIDAEGKVSAIDDSLAAGASSIALVAADCAAALTLKGSDNGATALTSTAAFTKNITITGGKADISNANLDGTLTISAAATVTAGDNAITVSNTAGTVTLTGAGAITKTGAGTLALNLSTGNAGAITVSDSPSITITNTTAGSATARTVGNITLGTGALSITGGAGTNHITLGKTLGATAGTVSITGGAANVTIGNLATTGALSITAGAGTISTGTYTGNPSITGGGTGLITLGAINGNVTVTGHAASALNIGAVTATAVNVTTAAASVTIGAVTGNVTVVDAAGGNGTINLGAVSGTLGITSGNHAPITVALGANNITGVTTITGGSADGNKVTLTGTGTGTTNIAGGHVDVSGRSNATLNITAASTVKIGANPVSTANTAFTANITGTGLVTIGDASTVIISGVTVPGSNVAIVQQTGTVLTIGGTAAGAVSIASDSTITGVTINAGTVTSLTNNKTTLESLTVNAGKTLSTLTIGGTTITTLTNNGTIVTIAAGSTATITTLTLGEAGVITNALATGANLTITNIDQSAVATAKTLNLGNLSTTITTVKGHSVHKLTLTSSNTLTALTVDSGVVDISGTTANTFKVAATTNTTVTANGKNLASIKGAAVITLVDVANATVDDNITELALSSNITTKLTINSGTVSNVTGIGSIAALDMNGGTLTAYNAGTITNFTLNGGTVTTIDKDKMTNLIIGTNSASPTALNATVTGGTGNWTIQALESTSATSANADKVTATWSSATSISLEWKGDANETNVTFEGNDATVAVKTSDGANVSQLVITKP